MSISDAQAWTVIIVSIGSTLSGLIVAIIGAYKTGRVHAAVDQVREQTNGRLSSIETELRATKAELVQAGTILRESERARSELVTTTALLAAKITPPVAEEILTPAPAKVIQP